MKRYLSFLLLFLFFGCSNDNTIGSGTEVGNGYIAAEVINSDGLQIKGANIIILSSDDLPDTLASDVSDDIGRFVVKRPVDTMVSVLIFKDSLSFFIDSLYPTVDSINKNIFILKKSSKLNIVVTDSSEFVGSNIFISGTGISVNSSEITKSGEHWIVTFNNVPEISRVQIIKLSNDSVEGLTGSFNINSGEDKNIVGDIIWRKFDKPQQPLVSLSGIGDKLWWCSDSVVLEFKNGEILNSYYSDDFFNFNKLTTTAMGIDTTLWLANNNGFIGYITKSGYYAMIPSQICTSSIISLTANWSIDLGKGINKNDSLSSGYLFTDDKFTKIINDKSNGVWASTDDGRIYHIYSNGTSDLYTAVEGLPGDSIYDIELDLDGILWGITVSSVFKILKSGVVEIPVIQGEILTSVNLISINDNGIWFASQNELFILKDNTAYKINWIDEILNIESTFSYANGSYWVVSNDGLYEFK